MNKSKLNKASITIYFDDEQALDILGRIKNANKENAPKTIEELAQVAIDDFEEDFGKDANEGTFIEVSLHIVLDCESEFDSKDFNTTLFGAVKEEE